MVSSRIACGRGGRVVPWLLLVVALLGLIALGAYLGGRQLWAWGHYRDAQRALERREFQQAEQHLACCVEVWSSSAETFFEAARAARRAEDYDEADRYLSQAQKLGWVPEAIQLERALARVQRGDVAGDEFALRDYVEKHKNDTDPDVSIILEGLSKGYLKSFRLALAVYALNLWLEREPRNAQALLWRGGVRDRLGDFEAAETDYRRAVEAEPDLDRARIRLAEDLLQNHKTEEALQHLLHLQERQPQNPLITYDLAQCRRDQGRTDEARVLLDHMLSEHQRDVEALLKRPRLGEPQGPEEEWWRQAVDQAPYELRHPRYILDLYVRALIERAEMAGTPAEKESYLRQAIALNPYDEAANYHLFQCLERQNKPEAKKYHERWDKLTADRALLGKLNRAIMDDPHDPDLRCRIAEILLRNGQPHEARRWVESALREEPRYGPALELLKKCSGAAAR
jgi:tetratricopeptide (TPR) repeat protein